MPSRATKPSVTWFADATGARASAATASHKTRECDERDGARCRNCGLFKDEFDAPLLSETSFAHFERDALSEEKATVGRGGAATLTFGFALAAAARLTNASAASFAAT